MSTVNYNVIFEYVAVNILVFPVFVTRPHV